MKRVFCEIRNLGSKEYKIWGMGNSQNQQILGSWSWIIRNINIT